MTFDGGETLENKRGKKEEDEKEENTEKEETEERDHYRSEGNNGNRRH